MEIINKFRVMDAKVECRKTIESAKMQPWGRDLPWGNIFIAGGFIVSHIQLQPPKDIDLYFESDDAMEKAVAILTKNPEYIKDVDPKYREVLGRDGKMITEWAITMNTGHSFITKHYGEPKELKKSFDYLHCCTHYEVATDQLYISEAQYLAITNKKLVVNNLASVTNWRESKFLQRGYTK